MIELLTRGYLLYVTGMTVYLAIAHFFGWWPLDEEAD